MRDSMRVVTGAGSGGRITASPIYAGSYPAALSVRSKEQLPADWQRVSHIIEAIEAERLEWH